MPRKLTFGTPYRTEATKETNMETETTIEDSDQDTPIVRVWADEDEFQVLVRRVTELEVLVSKGDET